MGSRAGTNDFELSAYIHFRIASSQSHEDLSPVAGHLLTTLLCILLSALLTRRLALCFGCTDLCWILAAAAMEIPEAPERSVRLKAEENVLTVLSSRVSHKLFAQKRRSQTEVPRFIRSQVDRWIKYAIKAETEFPKVLVLIYDF
jgi:hypothetical protein